MKDKLIIRLKIVIGCLYKWLSNRYISTLLFFLVWIVFIDKNKFFTQRDYSQKLNQIYKDQKYYIQEIEQIKYDLHELTNNPAELEAFARKKYYMKRKNEDIFIVEKVKPKERYFLFFEL